MRQAGCFRLQGATAADNAGCEPPQLGATCARRLATRVTHCLSFAGAWSKPAAKRCLPAATWEQSGNKTARTPGKTEDQGRPVSKTSQQVSDFGPVCKTSTPGSNPGGASNFPQQPESLVPAGHRRWHVSGLELLRALWGCVAEVVEPSLLVNFAKGRGGGFADLPQSMKGEFPPAERQVQE
jgi:hypothetical protein